MVYVRLAAHLCRRILLPDLPADFLLLLKVSGIGAAFDQALDIPDEFSLVRHGVHHGIVEGNDLQLLPPIFIKLPEGHHHLLEEAVYLELPGNMILLRQPQICQKFTDHAGNLNALADIRHRLVGAVCILLNGEKPRLDHIAVGAHRVINEVVVHFLFLAVLNRQLQQLDLLFVRMDIHIHDYGLKIHRFGLLPLKSSEAGVSAVAVHDAAIRQRDARLPLADDGNVFLGLLNRLGIALNDKVLNDPVVDLRIQAAQRVPAVFRLIAGDPCGDAVIPVVVIKGVQADPVNRIDHRLSTVGDFSGERGFLNDLGAHQLQKASFGQFSPHRIRCRLRQTGKRRWIYGAAFRSCPYAFIDLTDFLRTFRVDLSAEQRHGVQSPFRHGLLQILLTDMSHDIPHAHQFPGPGAAVLRKGSFKNIIPFAVQQTDAVCNVQRIHQLPVIAAVRQVPLIAQGLQDFLPPV